jgi:UPF0755 protein
MRRTLPVLLSIFVVALAAGVVAFRLLDRRTALPFKGYETAEQFVELPPASPAPVIGRMLVDAGVISDTLTFRLALWKTGTARRLRAGEYRFDRPMSAVEVIEKIARGEVYLKPITFPEGLTISEMAVVFEEHGFGSAAAFRQAASDAALVGDLDPGARDLEGYLFPDTYPLSRRTSAADVIHLMVRRFREVFGQELMSGAAAQGLTVHDAVTLASLVEKETARPDERPRVAAVYLNRLRIRMALQCDPTVIYALQRAGRYDGNLTRANLAFNSPYNTYRVAGLPPGPIAAPGRASLEAAVRPARVDYLYFVSRNDGSHEFARKLEEHNRNVRRYQTQASRQKRSKSRPSKQAR